MKNVPRHGREKKTSMHSPKLSCCFTDAFFPMSKNGWPSDSNLGCLFWSNPLVTTWLNAKLAISLVHKLYPSPIVNVFKGNGVIILFFSLNESYTA